MNSIYNVYLTRANKPQITGTYPKNDKQGRRLSNYGCGEEPCVSVYCEITNENNRIVYSLEPYIPAEIFLNKKEGDIVEAGKYLFKLQQRTKGDTRNFEDVFNSKFSEGFYKTFPSINFTPEISCNKQVDMLKKFRIFDFSIN